MAIHVTLPPTFTPLTPFVPAEPPTPEDNILTRDLLRALGYTARIVYGGAFDVIQDGYMHLLGNSEARALSVSPGPHPKDLMVHSVRRNSLTRDYTLPPRDAADHHPARDTTLTEPAGHTDHGRNLALLILEQLKDPTPERLGAALYLTDRSHLQMHGHAVSGVSYLALPGGPLWPGTDALFQEGPGWPAADPGTLPEEARRSVAVALDAFLWLNPSHLAARCRDAAWAEAIVTGQPISPALLAVIFQAEQN